MFVWDQNSSEDDVEREGLDPEQEWNDRRRSSLWNKVGRRRKFGTGAGGLVDLRIRDEQLLMASIFSEKHEALSSTESAGSWKNAKGVRVKRKFGISRGRRKTIWEKECRNWGAGRREVMSGDKEKARIILLSVSLMKGNTLNLYHWNVSTSTKIYFKRKLLF